MSLEQLSFQGMASNPRSRRREDADSRATSPTPPPHVGSYSPMESKRDPIRDELAAFREFGEKTRVITTEIESDGTKWQIPTYVNEFWTARQRQSSSLHEVSYRACFKPQLPRFFIERFTRPGDVVYDPFMGRGTTLIEAALLGRCPYGCDVNPLSEVFVRGRLTPPTLEAVTARLAEIDFHQKADLPEDLRVFYHEETLRQIVNLKSYLVDKKAGPGWDELDDWIALVALNRLTGHSPGFFSVYTLPPNQAVSLQSQRKINEKRQQTPTPRDVPKLILKKSRQLLEGCDLVARAALNQISKQARLFTSSCESTPKIPDNSVSLVVTSPPFLNIVDYAGDNWLRCWFLGIDPKNVKLTVPKKLHDWQHAMTRVFHELARVLKPGGYIAFEVGEVHYGKTRLDEAVVPCGSNAGLRPVLILINDQQFTKTANCWGVKNMTKGTNTNRIVLFQKEGERKE